MLCYSSLSCINNDCGSPNLDRLNSFIYKIVANLSEKWQVLLDLLLIES